ncbi:MAG: enoyl-CoA hydratase/isomerase family protein [Rhodospirillales bacterium]|nr:enoyl-CoA hydratase/isomerase family protein [Rhodospirillales bacterium]
MANIILAKNPPVATITLDQPDDLNRLTPDSMALLGRIIDDIGSDGTIHAVVVTGAGEGFFSAGLLNPAIRAGMSKEDVLEFVFLANRVFDALAALPQIVIAAINGNIMAGAVELALACDIRIAADDATLTMPEAKWGGFPGAGAPHRLGMAVGHARALELICTGREIDAAEMDRIGLVQALHPRAAVKDAAQAMALTIGTNGPLATRGAKRILRARNAPGFDDARALSDELRDALEWSEDVDEGLAAHREGRTAVFKGV